MRPAREVRIATRGACHRLLEVCPTTNMEHQLANRRSRTQSEATNLARREIQQVPAVEPPLPKQFQLLNRPKCQEVRIGRRWSCLAGPPYRARVRTWLNSRRQRTQEHIQ